MHGDQLGSCPVAAQVGLPLSHVRPPVPVARSTPAWAVCPCVCPAMRRECLPLSVSTQPRGGGVRAKGSGGTGKPRLYLLPARRGKLRPQSLNQGQAFRTRTPLGAVAQPGGYGTGTHGQIVRGTSPAQGVWGGA